MIANGQRVHRKLGPRDDDDAGLVWTPLRVWWFSARAYELFATKLSGDVECCGLMRDVGFRCKGRDERKGEKCGLVTDGGAWLAVAQLRRRLSHMLTLSDGCYARQSLRQVQHSRITTNRSMM